ncbi:MAG: serine/threonine protein kinase [Deltaproteobacteria bacterium]|nr:serine/threonine protein kinase [Deltaproteobacteria bacterium]
MVPSGTDDERKGSRVAASLVVEFAAARAGRAHRLRCRSGSAVALTRAMLFGDVLDRFHVRAPLARGGMGELWLADDDERHDVVLKTIRPDLVEDVEVRRCFRREIAVTARLRHAHIVRHIAHGRWCGLDVLALEHIRGVNLAEILSCTALPLGSALCVAEDIARALAYLHSLKDERGLPLGFVHGDLSPQNILIDEVGQAHLIDFGGVLIRGVPACPESIVCKPGYASPEQMRGGAIDGRSDQYALGIVLWEMLVGRELFEGDGARRNRPIPPVSSRVSVPFAVDATVIRMLAYEEGARFANTGEVADALAAVTWAHGPHESRGWLTARAQEPITLEGDAIVEGDEETRPMRRPEPAGWATRR